MKEKFVPTCEDNLIRSYDSYGPWFGSNGNDIVIANDCNNNRSSCCNFPSVYNRPGDKKLDQNQDSIRMFCGATDGSCFRVEEYEVFKVWYQ